jgi:hypothetical protein
VSSHKKPKFDGPISQVHLQTYARQQTFVDLDFLLAAQTSLGELVRTNNQVHPKQMNTGCLQKVSS